MVELIAIRGFTGSNGYEYITKGKNYTCTDYISAARYSEYFVVDNDGVGKWYDSGYFRKVRDHRNNVLSKILSCPST